MNNKKVDNQKIHLIVLNWNDKESPKYDTAGNPSLSKGDLIDKYINESVKKC